MRKNKRKWICILMLALLFCISAAAVTETRVQAAQTKETTGFVKKKGKTYYYKNGKKQKGLKTIDGSKYYFSTDYFETREEIASKNGTVEQIKNQL